MVRMRCISPGMFITEPRKSSVPAVCADMKRCMTPRCDSICSEDSSILRKRNSMFCKQKERGEMERERESSVSCSVYNFKWVGLATTAAAAAASACRVWHTKWPASCTTAVAAQHFMDIFNLSAVNANKTQINVPQLQKKRCKICITNQHKENWA